MKFKRFFIFIFLIVLLALLSIYYPHLTGKSISNNQEYELEEVFVTRVIDGDTLVYEINNITYNCRLLGINTPEKSQAYYQEAKDFLKQVENKTIAVLKDKEDEDKYGRKLRYVFYKNNLLNAEILQEGFATSFMLDGLKYKGKFRNAENYARNNGIRLWEKSENICQGCIKLLELNYIDEFFIINNNCNFDCDLNGWIIKDDANHFFKLDNLNAEETRRYDSKTKIWNDNGDRFFMRDEIGGLVVFYEY